MGDMGETFAAMKAATKQHRAEMLEQADTLGWLWQEALKEWS